MLMGYGFLMRSTPTITTVLVPRFSPQWVTSRDSVMTSPGLYSRTSPPSVVPSHRAICTGEAAESRTFRWSTATAMADTPRQKSPTLEDPPSASIRPPSAAPPKMPVWLLTANNPVAVLRDLPAHSSNTIDVTALDRRERPATPRASTTVAH